MNNPIKTFVYLTRSVRSLQALIREKFQHLMTIFHEIHIFLSEPVVGQ